MRKYCHLKPEFKKTWLKALRSADYIQGTGSLCDTEGHMCCLGVAADVAVDGYWVKNDLGRWDLEFPYKFGIANAAGSLPAILREQIGLSNTSMEYLVYLNDTCKWTFAQIADWIERNL